MRTPQKKTLGGQTWTNSEKDSKDSNGRIEEAQSRRTGHITPVEACRVARFSDCL